MQIIEIHVNHATVCSVSVFIWSHQPGKCNSNSSFAMLWPSNSRWIECFHNDLRIIVACPLVCLKAILRWNSFAENLNTDLTATLLDICLQTFVHISVPLNLCHPPSLCFCLSFPAVSKAAERNLKWWINKYVAGWQERRGERVLRKKAVWTFCWEERWSSEHCVSKEF